MSLKLLYAFSLFLATSRAICLRNSGWCGCGAAPRRPRSEFEVEAVLDESTCPRLGALKYGEPAGLQKKGHQECCHPPLSRYDSCPCSCATGRYTAAPKPTPLATALAKLKADRALKRSAKLLPKLGKSSDVELIYPAVYVGKGSPDPDTAFAVPYVGPSSPITDYKSYFLVDPKLTAKTKKSIVKRKYPTLADLLSTD